MPTIGTIRPADPGESPSELRTRAQSIRGHAATFWREPTVPQWIELADILEAEATALEVAPAKV